LNLPLIPYLETLPINHVWFDWTAVHEQAVEGKVDNFDAGVAIDRMSATGSTARTALKTRMEMEMEMEMESSEHGAWSMKYEANVPFCLDVNTVASRLWYCMHQAESIQWTLCRHISNLVSHKHLVVELRIFPKLKNFIDIQIATWMNFSLRSSLQGP
jgi:hypothetical protein